MCPNRLLQLGSYPIPATCVFGCALYLWVVQEGLLVVNAATSTPSRPLSVEDGLVPPLGQAQQTGVDLRGKGRGRTERGGISTERGIIILMLLL